MYYVHQKKGYELGNFINCTPAIKAAYDSGIKPVPVYFETSYIRELFSNSKYIRCLDAPTGKRLITTTYTKKGTPDYLHLLNIVKDKLKLKSIEGYKSFAPEFKTIHTKYCVVARGCLKNSFWKDKKEVGDSIYKTILASISLPVVFVGNTNDSLYRMEDWATDSRIVIDDIRKVARLIQNCSFFISNDTGLAHLAGAYNRKSFIIWKDTPLLKNKNPNPKAFYSKKGNWESDYIKWNLQNEA